MTPRDYAVEIEPNASPERLYRIEQVLHKFAGNLLTELAVNVDENAMGGRINYAHQAARMLRDEAHEHLNQTCLP
jgi:hypothetical protein